MNHISDIFQDVVAHTHNLGILNVVKVVGTPDKTTITSMSDDRTVTLLAETTDAYPELIGTFGLSQLNKLKMHLDCGEYREDAVISVTRQKRGEEEIPVGVHFENKTGDFRNDYRFMNDMIINQKIKNTTFNGLKWDVTLSPTPSAIQRFAYQASANSEHKNFVCNVDQGEVKFKFGELNSHGGEFTFASGVSGRISGLEWPVQQVLNILKLPGGGEVTIDISDEGLMMISLNSGLAMYRYYLPSVSA